MKSGISFQELAKLQEEQLSKQLPVTLEEAREQVQKIKARRNKRKVKKLPLGD